MPETLPPGPRMPVALQTLGNWCRPTAYVERARRRYGRAFTGRLLGQPPTVLISDPEHIKEIFQAPPEVLHPGEGARILEPVVGPNSVILLDEAPHLEQRKLLLPAFHGERMQRLAGLMAELTEAEVDSWPRGQVIALHPRLQRLTLEVILRTVFGLERGAQLDELRELLTRLLAFGDSPLSLMPPPPRALARLIPTTRRLERLSARVDALIYALIDERRRRGDYEDADDVLGMLLAARHEDGSQMSAQELRDELVTALTAGHETTASQLAWTFALLARAPRVRERLTIEIDAGDDDRYLLATINEAMRLHPVLPSAEPRLVKQAVEIGGVRYPPGVVLMASAYLVHHDPDVYPEPYAFRPERFLEQAPGTYTLIPFGGGRRRCIGASFALQEMKIVLRTVLAGCEVEAGAPGPERTRRRGITLSPARGCLVVLRERVREAAAQASPEHATAAA